MSVAGIVAEYNPLHNGHLRLIRRIREELGENTPVVVIMSGEFVQRGIPALTDRTSRVCALLSCGVDVVLELPFTFATGSADRFAHGAVSSLIRSGVITDLYFGAEHDSLTDLSEIAKIDFESDPAFSEVLDTCQKNGLSYAASWEQAASSVMASRTSGSDSVSPKDFSRIIHAPNNILAIAYLRELDRAGSSIAPHLLLREDAYHEESLKESAFPSATALRKQILTRYRSLSKGDFIASASELLLYMPVPMIAEMLHLWNSGTVPMGEKELVSSAIPLIRSMELSRIASAAHMGPQLAGHLKSAVRSMHFDPGKDISISFREAVETRCFSYTRILRALTSLVIGQNEEDLSHLDDPRYLRLLGFSEKGRTVLKAMRSGSEIPILSRASDAFHFGKDPDFSRMDELDRLSHDWWTMKARNTFEEDFKREVIQFKRNRLYRS